MASALATGEPVWDLDFDEKGNLRDSSAADDLIGQLGSSQVRDLFVMSHGWGASQADAESLYAAMFGLIVQAAPAVPTVGPLGFVRVFWPSLWFPPTNATAPSVTGSVQSGGGSRTPARAGTEQLSGAEIAQSLAQGFDDPSQRATLTQIGDLIDQAQKLAVDGGTDAAKQDLIDRIHERMTALATAVDSGVGAEDSGEKALLTTEDPADAYAAAARAFGTAPAGSSTQGIGDWFSSAAGGAKDVLRVFSYLTMKARAGQVGQSGLGPVLTRLHQQAPQVRVHLIGHSFGARLVSFALAGIPDAASSPVGSLTLVQGAFSHWSFAGAQGNPFQEAGALDGVADRVHGPLVATFSTYDWAVGVWYARASFLARQDQSAAVTVSRWGGMGSDGYQGVSPASDLVMSPNLPNDYPLEPGIFYRVDSQAVINDVQGQSFAGAHSDIRKLPVAELIVRAASAFG